MGTVQKPKIFYSLLLSKAQTQKVRGYNDLGKVFILLYSAVALREYNWGTERLFYYSKVCL